MNRTIERIQRIKLFAWEASETSATKADANKFRVICDRLAALAEQVDVQHPPIDRKAGGQ